jgi:hypothetical protein
VNSGLVEVMIDHSARADYFAEERVRFRVKVLAGRVADRRDTFWTPHRQVGNHLLATAKRNILKVRRHDRDVDIAPLVRVTASVGAIKKNGLYSNRTSKKPGEF